MAIVAHELGHAQQDKSGYFWLQMRSSIVGVASIGSNLGTWVLMGGVLLASFGGGLTVAWIGVMLMSAAVVFSLITLPVEFDASSRARQMLQRAGMMSPQESQGVGAVLNAAATPRPAIDSSHRPLRPANPTRPQGKARLPHR